MTNDIASELAKLHALSGAEYSRQVERIAMMKVFHPLENEVGIYTPGVLKNDDYQNQLVAARKAVVLGYKVYILPTPKESRTPDFILEKKNTFRAYDLKTVYGKSSVSTNLLDSIGQCNRILLNMQVEYSTRLLISDIKLYFEANPFAVEVMIFKGMKRIRVNRFIFDHPSYYRLFKKMYEK
jgi:hypothetical protein